MKSFVQYVPHGTCSRWLALVAIVALAAFQGLSTTAEASTPANRLSCNAIKGTPYLSHEERAWYWEYCLGRTIPPANTTQQSGGTIAEQFAHGYRSAGGPERLLPHILNRVIPCESSYNPYAVNYAGPYYGLMQFVSSTWNMVGGGNVYSPWDQGVNTARLLRIASPGSQWPVCWYA